jgi:hypothetical protein
MINYWAFVPVNYNQGRFMKKIIILISFLLSTVAMAAPAATPTETSEEITMDDLQAEFLNEADTLVVDETDETFLDEEIEKQKVVSEAQKNTPKTTVKAPAKTAVKK